MNMQLYRTLSHSPRLTSLGAKLLRLSSKAKQIRNPFNVPYDANPPWPAESRDELNLACIARLDAGQKGQDLLLGVLRLPHWRRRNVRLSLVGRATERKCAQKHGRITRVEKCRICWPSIQRRRRLGAIIMPWSCLRALRKCRVVVVEAMLCGRACIVTDVAGTVS